jgi:hypothetical protein
MPEMKIEVLGLNELIRASTGMAGQVQAELQTGMQKAVLIIEAEAKSLASARGADFARTIHSQVRGMGANIRGIVGTNDKRGLWFEQGTGIYHVPDAHQAWTIVATNRFALTIPVGAGGSARWAVQDLGPLKYQRMADAKGRALFRTPKGGSTFKESGAQNVIFRKKVTIKGMRPRPWLMKAYENKKADVVAVFRNQLADLNRRLATAAAARQPEEGG